MEAKGNEKCEAKWCGRNLLRSEKKNLKPNEAIIFLLKWKKFFSSFFENLFEAKNAMQN
jgi:hypothetical protein